MSIQSDPRSVPAISEQEEWWNHWNEISREGRPVDGDSERRARWVESRFERLREPTPEIIDIGCGTGWLSDRLRRFGRVTATDLAGDIVRRAAERYPEVHFRTGDFEALTFDNGLFDAAVCMETLSHVEDQPRFVSAISDLLRPGGFLMLTSQNYRVMRRLPIGPPGEGQIRRLLTMAQFRKVVSPRFEIIESRLVNMPGQNRLSRSRAIPAGAIVASRMAAVATRLGAGKTMVVMARKR